MRFTISNLLSTLLVALWCIQPLSAQQKPNAPTPSTDAETATQPVQLKRPTNFRPATATPEAVDFNRFSQSLTIPHRLEAQPEPRVISDKKTGLPIAIKGNPKGVNDQIVAGPVEQAFSYLQEMKETLKIQDPAREFVLRQQLEDEKGNSHLRLRQQYQGIPVFASEVVVHLKAGQVDFFNGRYFPSPDLEEVSPRISAEAAVEKVKQAVVDFSTLKELQALDIRLLPGGQQFASELIIYHVDGRADAAHLTWQITAFPNITDRWEYFIDALSGDILHQMKNSCQLFHDHGQACQARVDKVIVEKEKAAADLPSTSLLGKETAFATDLQNQTREINVYSVGSTYYMIDAARSMHNSANASLSNFPDDPAGVIWTLDAFDTSPQNSNFNYNHVTSNNNNWNDRNSVSAHYNGGEAYLYFEQVHQRNSINGNGGNIISLINVADENGNDMDNAFWNGAAMFYGNGKQAFEAPLAKALDVAGHEMSHGVIQATANLTYENQSGALNESFADIFGAMMDRDDWQIGEEVANGSVFPTGTMRDMQNPHNGGNSNDFYWQPDHMDEFVNLPNTPNGDFGGVHINSGIPNHAFYLFATAVGKDIAERIYYEALDKYLVASSQFVDLRIAVLRAAEDLYGQSEINAAANAFDQVGIIGDQGGTYETDVNQNPGDDLILFADLSRLDIFYPNDPMNPEQLSSTDQTSRPSVSDDGSFAVFVDDQKELKGITIDWTDGSVEEFALENPAQSIWRNIVVAKDGSKVAFLYELNGTDRDRQIVIFDFVSQTSKTFELYNPTTSNDGSSTGDAKFADVMEFDVTGEFLLYDAFNELSGVNGEDISYWDIGMMKVWSNPANGFDNGVVTKIFSGLQENESVGNPTFAKNSPYIIAFDYFAADNQGNETYILYGANIEQNEIGIIDDQIFKLSFPSYAPNDQQILYSDINNGQDIIIQQDLAATKITGEENWVGLIGDATWAVWFANGQRDLVSINDLVAAMQLEVYPNPFEETLVLDFVVEESGDARVELLDVLGRVRYAQDLVVQAGSNRVQLPDLAVGAGVYTLRLQTERGGATRQVVKRRP